MQNEEKVLFREVQYFRQWWLILPLAVMPAFILHNVFHHLVINRKEGYGEIPALLLITVIATTIIVLVLFFITHLKTEITKAGIFVKFSPFHFGKWYFRWDEVDKAYVRKYSPLWEFGGWGIRHNMLRRSGAYNVSGNMGLQLELKNGRKLLIGTRHENEIREVLNTLNKNSVTDRF